LVSNGAALGEKGLAGVEIGGATDRDKYLQAARVNGKPDFDFSVGVLSVTVSALHAPVTACLAESNPPRPTRCIRSERRLRRNRGLTRRPPLLVSACPL